MTIGDDNAAPILLSMRAAEARGCPGRAALQATALDSSGVGAASGHLHRGTGGKEGV